MDHLAAWVQQQKWLCLLLSACPSGRVSGLLGIEHVFAHQGGVSWVPKVWCVCVCGGGAGSLSSVLVPAVYLTVYPRLTLTPQASCLSLLTFVFKNWYTFWSRIQHFHMCTYCGKRESRHLAFPSPQTFWRSCVLWSFRLSRGYFEADCRCWRLYVLW